MKLHLNNHQLFLQIMLTFIEQKDKREHRPLVVQLKVMCLEYMACYPLTRLPSSPMGTVLYVHTSKDLLKPKITVSD